MISEGSCDTEDWSNENRNGAFKLIIFYNITVFCIFDQIVYIVKWSFL